MAPDCREQAYVVFLGLHLHLLKTLECLVYEICLQGQFHTQGTPDIWDEIFPDYAVGSNEELKTIISKQADDRINSWHHNFSMTAITILFSAFWIMGMKPPEEITCIVTYYMGPREKGDREQVFYY
ncbi:hypothetical protein B0H10DRAFT_1950830 [Mycena sp. CBHHK59/15]|nr:hypothetical protein B0H10DRAFT_1950830 [Mycena sp. CBHHK59/15]